MNIQYHEELVYIYKWYTGTAQLLTFTGRKESFLINIYHISTI